MLFLTASLLHIFIIFLLKKRNLVFISTQKLNKKSEENKDTNTIVLINKANIFVSLFFMSSFLNTEKGQDDIQI